MTTKLRKAVISTIAALTLGAGVTATATPSAAQGWHGHRWHGHGWHGHDWHGHDWHGGGLHGGYWRVRRRLGRAGRGRRPWWPRARCARRIGLCLRAGLLRRLQLAEPASL